MKTNTISLPASFHWLNVTQFLGALNDNIFKFLVMFALISYFGDTNTSEIVSIVGMLFVIPFILISPTAGILADLISKQRIIIFIKFLEIAIMLLGTAALTMRLPYLIYVALFFMSVQSALFGPAKYGILPELLRSRQLSRANSFIVCFTFLAIILGTFLAPATSALTHSNYGIASVLCVIIAVGGTLTSVRIPHTPPSGSTKKISAFAFKDIITNLRDFRHDRFLMFAIFGSMYYYLIGAYLQLNLIPYGIEVLHLGHEQSAYLFLIAAVGIGTGSLCAGKLSAHHFEFSTIIFGAIGLIIGLAGLYYSASLVGAVLFVVFLGTSSGLLIIPLQSLIQFRSPLQQRGSLLATSNVLNWIAILFASILLYIFNAFLRFSSETGFLILAALTLVLFALILFAVPFTRTWLVNFCVTRRGFNVRIQNDDIIPRAGTIVIICASPSWREPLAILSTLSCPIEWWTTILIPRYVSWLIPSRPFSHQNFEQTQHSSTHNSCTIHFVSGENILDDLSAIQSYAQNILVCSLELRSSSEKKNRKELHAVFSNYLS